MELHTGTFVKVTTSYKRDEARQLTQKDLKRSRWIRSNNDQLLSNPIVTNIEL